MTEERNLIENVVPAETPALGNTAPSGEEPTPGARPKITFMGNSYDLASVGAVITGVILLAACFTCGQALYCLPVIPLILGLIGLIMAKDSVDAQRTRLLSWIGIGGGGLTMLLFVAAIVAYFVFIIFIVAVSSASSSHYYYDRF